MFSVSPTINLNSHPGDGEQKAVDLSLLSDLSGRLNGSVSFSRASGQYVKDHEGILRRVADNCPAFEGARIVTNYLCGSDDLTTWVKVGGTTTPNKDTVIFAGAGVNYRIERSTNILTAAIGRTFRYSFTVPPVANFSDPTTKIRINFSGGVGTWLTPGTTAFRYSRTITSNATGGYVFPSVEVDKACTVTGLGGFQLEDVTGQSNQAPGEHVVNNNTTDKAISQSFPYLNPHTVDANGVVTDTGARTPISSSLLKGLLLEPARTNKCTCYGAIPGDTLGSELSSGTLVPGRKYEITATTANYFGAGLVVGNQFIATTATALDASNKVKEVQFAVGTKSYYDSGGVVWRNNHTNMTLSGDAAAVLTTVDDAANIPTELKALLPSGKVYKLDNSLATVASSVTFGGTVGNLNAHSSFAYIKGSGGNVTVRHNSTGTTIAAPTPWTLLKSENVVPSATTQQLVFDVAAGVIIYFILPQLEEGPNCTSVIPTYGASVTRSAGKMVVDKFLPMNDYSIYCEVAFTSLGSGTHRIFQNTADGSNYVVVSFTNTAAQFNHYVDGINKISTRNLTPVVGVVYKCICRFNTDGTVDIFVNGVVGSRTGTPARAKSVATINDFPNTGFVTNGTLLTNVRLYRRPLSDAQCISLTS